MVPVCHLQAAGWRDRAWEFSGRYSVDYLESAGVAMALGETWRVGGRGLEGLGSGGVSTGGPDGSQNEESSCSVHIGRPSSDLDSW